MDEARMLHSRVCLDYSSTLYRLHRGKTKRKKTDPGQKKKKNVVSKDCVTERSHHAQQLKNTRKHLTPLAVLAAKSAKSKVGGHS